MCPTFNGLAPVICGVDAATITGFPAYCDNALQCKKREEKMKILLVINSGFTYFNSEALAEAQQSLS